jgi:hypothetical protein
MYLELASGSDTMEVAMSGIVAWIMQTNLIQVCFIKKVEGTVSIGCSAGAASKEQRIC